MLLDDHIHIDWPVPEENSFSITDLGDQSKTILLTSNFWNNKGFEKLGMINSEGVINQSPETIQVLNVSKTTTDTTVSVNKNTRYWLIASFLEQDFYDEKYIRLSCNFPESKLISKLDKFSKKFMQPKIIRC